MYIDGGLIDDNKGIMLAVLRNSRARVILMIYDIVYSKRVSSYKYVSTIIYINVYYFIKYWDHLNIFEIWPVSELKKYHFNTKYKQYHIAIFKCYLIYF